MAPEDIVFREVESESVVIQWTVAYISYSPETYVVQYGTSRETLVHNSSRRASEVGTTTYSVPLSGLRDNTTYYVQVLATNTALRSSRSSVESFTILVKTSAGVRLEYLLSMCLYCHAVCEWCTHVYCVSVILTQSSLTLLEGCLIPLPIWISLTYLYLCFPLQ